MKGKRFGRWFVLSEKGKNRDGKILWECKCDCGKIGLVSGKVLRLKKSRSCGCLNKELLRIRSITHGGCGTILHNRWRGMLQRCKNPNNKNYQCYGGRGITVCERWKSFENFRGDMEQTFKPRLTLDRIDNNKGYSKENCKWATQIEQARNTRRNHLIIIGGITKTLSEWSEISKLSSYTIFSRIKRGWSNDLLLSSRYSQCLKITIGKEIKPITEWVKISGINYSTLQDRLNRKWPENRLLEVVK